MPARAPIVAVRASLGAILRLSAPARPLALPGSLPPGLPGGLAGAVSPRACRPAQRMRAPLGVHAGARPILGLPGPDLRDALGLFQRDPECFHGLGNRVG